VVQDQNIFIEIEQLLKEVLMEVMEEEEAM
jgi:hypothetical protein